MRKRTIAMLKAPNPAPSWLVWPLATARHGGGSHDPHGVGAGLALLVPCAGAQDAVVTDCDKYKVMLENPCVRVLDYRDQPGERTQQHHHPAFVLYAPDPFERTLTLPNGKVLKRSFKAGDVMWSDAQTHFGENIGTTPTHVLIVELKTATAVDTGARVGR